MRVAVVVPALLQTNALVWLLIQCASLVRSTQHDLSLYVVANRLQTCSADELRRLLGRVFVGTSEVCHQPGVDRCVAESRNYGLAAAGKADYCLMLDTDVELELATVDVLVGFGNAHPDVTLWSGAATNYHDGPKDPATVSELPDFSCCMLRPSAFAEHGQFDPYYRMGYGEDVDYLYRVWLAGGRTACVHRARLVHHTGMTKNIDPSLETEVRNALVANERRFKAKWGLPSDVRDRAEVLRRAHRRPFGDLTKPLSWCDIPDKEPTI